MEKYRMSEHQDSYILQFQAINDQATNGNYLAKNLLLLLYFFRLSGKSDKLNAGDLNLFLPPNF